LGERVKCSGERQRERERDTQAHTLLSVEPDAGARSHDPEIMT